VIGPGDSLRVCEAFVSLAGETSLVGTPAVFVRLAGCNLRCAWCDTPRAWEGGQEVTLARLEALVLDQWPGLVVLTGGEPLLQPASLGLAARLRDRGRRVMVETNGSLDVGVVPPGVTCVMDLKCPGSGQAERMRLANLGRLRAGDELKIVVADRADFDWARAVLDRDPPGPGVNILVSPAVPACAPGALADWVLAARMQARLQVQLHRLLWPDGQDGQPLALG
jgi:7-carboxy-7-deazaguanine synthase